MSPNQYDRDFGRLEGAVESIGNQLKEIDKKLDNHMAEEEERLNRIEHQLSLARFFVMFFKALALTIAFLLAFKFGDIKDLWDFRGK